MHMTVAEILALPVVLAGDPQVVGGGSLDRPVRWVHVSDVADLSGLLQGGELVLTTGGPLADPDACTRYLGGLFAAGAAGVVVELGTSLQAIPSGVAREADKLQLPVIALYRKIRFVDVTEQVHRSIVAEQYDEVAFARHVHEVFTELTMRRATLGEIVDACGQIAESAIVLEDLNRQVVAFTTHGDSPTGVIHDWERRSRLTPVLPETGETGPESWLTTPVGPGRQEWGRLIAPSGGSSLRGRMALERAAQALALHRMIEQHQTTLEQQAQSGLVEELRRGRIKDEAEASARARALGVKPALSYIPLTVRVREEPCADQVLLQRRQIRLLDAVRHAVRTARLSALTANPRPGQIDVLLSQTHASSAEEILTNVSSVIRASLQRLDDISRCVVGVGPASTRLIDAAVSLDDSAHVAEVALSLPDDAKAFHRASDTRLRGLLALIRSDPRVQAFAEVELRGVLENRARHGDDLFQLLREFLNTGGNKTELAKRLHLSRPTLYTKLAIVQRLLGVDLDDAESRTSLHTAMLVLDHVNP